MKTKVTLLTFVFALACSPAWAQVATTQPVRPAAVDGEITVYFSPQGGATQAIVNEIAQAKNTVQVQAYSFTSALIAKALLDAHKRGVKVAAVLDASQRTAKYTSATFLFNAGIPVLIDDKHAIAHNKVILIDGKTVITGSFNFSKAAEESNAENLLVIKDRPGLARAYIENFDRHRAHAVPYQGLKGADAGPNEDAQGVDQERAPLAQGARVTKAESTADADVMVHVTKSGKKYHAAGCGSLAKSDIPMKLADAKAAGFTACSRCRPQE